MYIEIAFTQTEIDSFRNQTVDFKAYYDKGSRWIGRVGEEAFRRWLTEEKVPYKDLTNIGPSWIDFTVGNLKIDVKTVGANSVIKGNYGINFTKAQYDLMESAEPALQPNCFVFCRFIGELNQVVFVGIKSKKKFDKDKRELVKGTQLTDKYTVPEDQYEVFIDDCESPNRLIEYAKLHSETTI
jgi:hypothetical protein